MNRITGYLLSVMAMRSLTLEWYTGFSKPAARESTKDLHSFGKKLRTTEGPNVYVAADSRPDTMPNQSAAKEHRANGAV
jgi:hypothetical protein